MILMTLLYLAGLVSGVVLVVIALGTWIMLAARKLKDSHDSQTGFRSQPAYTGRAPVARHRSSYRRRRDRVAPGTP